MPDLEEGGEDVRSGNQWSEMLNLLNTTSFEFLCVEFRSFRKVVLTNDLFFKKLKFSQRFSQKSISKRLTFSGN